MRLETAGKLSKRSIGGAVISHNSGSRRCCRYFGRQVEKSVFVVAGFRRLVDLPVQSFDRLLEPSYPIQYLGGLLLKLLFEVGAQLAFINVAALAGLGDLADNAALAGLVEFECDFRNYALHVLLAELRVAWRKRFFLALVLQNSGVSGASGGWLARPGHLRILHNCAGASFSGAKGMARSMSTPGSAMALRTT